MARSAETGTRGIVNPDAGFERFALNRYEPGVDPQWAVDRYWVVRWDVRDEGGYDQRVVPHPAVHLVFEGGGAEIEPISSEDFTRRIEGCGQVLGVKFRPAGFRPFLGAPVSGIAGRRFPASAVFGPPVDALARALGDAEDLNDRVELVERFLRCHGALPLPMTTTVNAIVDHVAGDRSITRVDDLARRLGTNTRRLQRLFAEHVGLGPKWVINRCRLHAAAEVAAHSAAVDWPQLALALGYSDQSHLVRDFTTTVGSPPERYVRLIGATRSRSGGTGGEIGYRKSGTGDGPATGGRR